MTFLKFGWFLVVENAGVIIMT